MIVDSLMRRDVVVARPDDSVATISDLMQKSGVRSVVVSDEDRRVKGIVTDSDLLFRALGKRDAHKTSIDEIMTKDPLVVEPGVDIYEVLRIMEQNRFRRMPVVQDGQLVGIISVGDIAPQMMVHLELLRGGL